METHWDLTEGVRKPPWWDVHTFFETGRCSSGHIFLCCSLSDKSQRLPSFLCHSLRVAQIQLELCIFFSFLSCSLPKFLRIFWEELMFTVLLRLSVQDVKTSRLDSNGLFKTSLQKFCGCAIWVLRSRSSLTTLAMPEWNYATLS